MKRWSLLIFTMLTILVLSCAQEKVISNGTVTFSADELNVPAVISTTSDKSVLATCRVSHPDGDAGITLVEIVFSDSLGNKVLGVSMYDDGDAAGSGSGDVIAFDHIYSAILVGSRLGLPDGEYTVRVRAEATSGENRQTPSQLVDLFPNQPPEILKVDFPDTIAAGMPPADVFITVNDNDGLHDILWVILQGFNGGGNTPAFQDTIWNPLDNSPVFRMTVDSAFAARRKGNIQLHFLAEDRAGDFSEAVNKNVFFVNTPPVLLSIQVPDTIMIPVTGINVDTVRAEVTDGQSLEDIQSVYFISQIRRTDGTLGSPSDPVYLLDDGDLTGSGDHFAGDGQYSRIIRIEPGNTAGTYLFSFRTVDYVNQHSDVLIDSVQVVKQ